MSKPTRAAVMNRAASKISTVDLAGRFVWSFVYPAYMGGAWCAGFVLWCFKVLGAPVPEPGIAGFFYTPTGRQAAIGNGTYLPPTTASLARLKSGDFVFYDWQDDGVTDHISFFERRRPDLGPGYFQTIEGNTSSGVNGSQGNGRGVWRRVRHLRDVSGFVDASVYYADADASKPQELTGLSADVIKRLQSVLNKRGATLDVDGVIGPKTIAAWQRQMGTPADGVVSGPESLFVQAVQGYLNRMRAGIVRDGKKIQPEWEDLAVDGVWGPRTAKAVTTYLTKWNGGFTR